MTAKSPLTSIRRRIESLFGRLRRSSHSTDTERDGDGVAERYDGFEFNDWLDTVTSPDPTPAATEAAEATADTTSEFDFVAWLSADETVDPVELGLVADDSPSLEPRAVDSQPPTADRPPVKFATIALFLSVLLLTVLSVAGVIPPLGPADGLVATGSS